LTSVLAAVDVSGSGRQEYEEQFQDNQTAGIAEKQTQQIHLPRDRAPMCDSITA
jgi:hypothetical protein